MTHTDKIRTCSGAPTHGRSSVIRPLWISQSVALRGAATQPVGQNTRHPRQPLPAKIFHFAEFGNSVCVGHPGSSLRGDLVVVLIASRLAMDAAASARDGAGRAGSPCEPATACGRAALLGCGSSVSFRLRRLGRENCGEMAGRAYGKTVWSWPSLLGSSCRRGVCEPNRADSI